jgi:SAM-dependent methyltransferase
MSEDDRIHWDERYQGDQMSPVESIGPPPEFANHEHLLPTSGNALELACGRGRGALWLAERGLDYHGVDVSPFAIDLARELVDSKGLADHCRLEVHDLDVGLPDGPPADLILCYKFRDPGLDEAIIDRLKPGGILAIAVLSEVDRGPGNFRIRPGELIEAFSTLETLLDGEGDGMAWLLAKKL